MPRSLLILLLLAASAPQAAPPHASELFLAGGSLRTCSDLAPQACRGERDAPERRLPSRHRVDAEAIARALDPVLWRASRGAPAPAALAPMLASAKRDADWGRDELEDHFAGFCALKACRDKDTASPWQRLLDDEQAAVLSALELPQIRDGRRAVERADLADSREQAGVDVLRAFVAAAAERADGRPARIAVVTASAVDPFDPVDFYLDAFRELGAEAVWWPVDAALEAATARGDCDALESLRREHLQLAARDRVYPDLAEQQRQACLDPDGTAALPSTVQGMFFAGGDQWRHRQAFFDADDRPNAWLASLRAAHASGELVVGGTSAGTAVQGGAAMLSNGTSAQALLSGAQAGLPMMPGCTRAARCEDGRDEDTLTFWPGGGLGLLPGWTMDTHFSERARELRLLLLMHAAQVDFALGVDETSAIRVARQGDRLQFEALGKQGGWLFERRPADGSGTLAARVHYLAPGAVFALGADGLQASHPVAAADTRHRGPTPTDALAPEALRTAARALGDCDGAELRLAAGAGVATLACTKDTRSWSGRATGDREAATGVGNLLLRFAPARATPPIPPTPAGAVLADWLGGFNAADRGRIAAFQQTYKRETPVDDVLQQRRETGGFTLEKVESVSPTRVVAVLHERLLPDSRIRLDLTVEPAPAKAIAKLEVEPLPVKRLSESGFARALDAYLQRLAKEDLFSGAVLVARGDRYLARGAWGLSDRGRNLANKEDSQFRLGSMNKVITAVAALQLVEQGKLALDRPIGNYLPDYPNRDAAIKVTLRHLLTHRAGVGEIAFNDSPEFATPDEFIARREAMRTPADYLRQYGSQPLQFEPGTTTAYSSLGFMIVGALIEQASGETYYDYVQANIFDVAGMGSTGSLPESELVSGRAVGYTWLEDTLVPNGHTLPYRGSPAGGGYSTTGDLFRFAQALRAGKLLSPGMTTEATRLHSGWQGLGFEVIGEGDMLSFGHGGMAPGMNAHFRVYPALNTTVVVLSNLDPPAAGLVYAFIADRMPITADGGEGAEP